LGKTIGILGCGWLGTPLAEDLILAGYDVLGSTTSPKKLDALAKKGIQPFLVQLHEHRIDGEIEEFLRPLDVLIINVPPNLRKDPQGDYFQKMMTLLERITHFNVPHVLFISSTSVYGNNEGEITEETVPSPITPSGKQLLVTEQQFFNGAAFATTAIRFGGLIGEDRHPVYRLSGRELSNGEELINLIHRKDCILMIRTIVENGYWNELFNGVYPYHPTKHEYYAGEAKKRNIPPPLYKEPTGVVRKKKVIFRNFYVKNHVLTTSISS